MVKMMARTIRTTVIKETEIKDIVAWRNGSCDKNLIVTVWVWMPEYGESSGSNSWSDFRGGGGGSAMATSVFYFGIFFIFLFNKGFSRDRCGQSRKLCDWHRTTLIPTDRVG